MEHSSQLLSSSSSRLRSLVFFAEDEGRAEAAKRSSAISRERLFSIARLFLPSFPGVADDVAGLGEGGDAITLLGEAVAGAEYSGCAGAADVAVGEEGDAVFLRRNEARCRADAVQL